MIENLEGRGFDIICIGPHVQPGDHRLVFGNEHNPLPPVNLMAPSSMIDLLMEVGCFASRQQARKNWKGPISIPPGFSEFTVGKKRHRLTIWNPTECSDGQ